MCVWEVRERWVCSGCWEVGVERWVWGGGCECGEGCVVRCVWGGECGCVCGSGEVGVSVGRWV